MRRRVVITGMGVVSPNGIGKEEFGRAVLDGRSGVRRISRFDASALTVQIAGEVVGFDELAWVEARERRHMSRSVPLALAASTEALADAGLDPAKMSLEERRGVAVLLGSGGGAQDFTEQQYALYLTGHPKQVSVYSVSNGTMGTLSSELSMRFGFRGQSQVVTSACASSSDAMGYALRLIQMGITPMALSGGVESPVTEGILRTYILMRAVTAKWNHAPERASRPFTADRDGFVVAEGSWMFMMEEYEHARARGARIYAEIAGYGSTCEAYHRVRLQECGEEPARAIELALQDAGIGPGDVHYVSLHGTSTDLNDRIETRALKLALNSHAARTPMSALKSQIGHAQGASGAAAVAATLAGMERGQVPPTLNLDNPDPECDLDYTPEAGRKTSIEHAVVNCIAFGSKNSALVLRKVA